MSATARRDAERRDREVVALESQHRKSDDDREQRRDGHRDRDVGEQVVDPVVGEHAGTVRPQAEERDLPEQT